MSNYMVVISWLLAVSIVCINSQQQYTTPVPILKQINRHNEDGSYSYGYEGADGSFKIETKYANGEVFGKYGYVDDQGKSREIEYGASQRGFEPQGSDINVPPPTLKNNNPYPLGPNEQDDGQYREDPSVYYKDEKYNNNARPPASNFRLDNFNRQPSQQPHYTSPVPSTPQQPYNSNNNNQYYNPPQHRFQQPQQPQQPQQQSYYQPQPYYNPQNNYNGNNAPIIHHPALRNFDLNSGSYSLDYTGK